MLKIRAGGGAYSARSRSTGGLGRQPEPTCGSAEGNCATNGLHRGPGVAWAGASHVLDRPDGLRTFPKSAIRREPGDIRNATMLEAATQLRVKPSRRSFRSPSSSPRSLRGTTTAVAMRTSVSLEAQGISILDPRR